MNKLLSKILVLVLVSAVPMVAFAATIEVVPAQDVGMSEQRVAAIKQRLQQELDNDITGGIQVLVARRGQVVLYENLGYANITDNLPITDATLFRIFSMTKPIVGAAMMMLYEEGVFSLSDPVSMYIPEFVELQVYAGTDNAGKMNLETPRREATIRDLMQHTAGLTYGIFGDTPVDRMYLEKKHSYDDSLQETIEKLSNTPLLYHPGERFVYSYAVEVQSHLIEKWTGGSAGKFVQERLLGPLGMERTLVWADSRNAPLLANIYTHNADNQLVKFDGPRGTNHFRAPGGFRGGGQLISTAADYWRFTQMLLNGGELDGVRYLAPKSVEMMTTDRISVVPEVPYDGIGFGLNLAVINDPLKVDYPVSLGEYFWSGLATTLFWTDPEEELIVIMLTQYLPFNEPHFRDLMHRMVYAAIID